MNINKVGLEAEFFLRDEAGQLVYPEDHGFSYDEFCILGEFRGKPGKTRAQTIANFVEAYFEVLFKAKDKKLTVDIKTGWDTILPKFHSEILHKMGSKVVAQCKNIYDIDILTLSDAEIKDGKMVGRKLSTGLHIHFSSDNENERKYSQYEYEKVNVSCNLGGASFNLDLFRRKSEHPKEEIFRTTASRITKPVVRHIIQDLDTNVLPGAKLDLPESAGFR